MKTKMIVKKVAVLVGMLMVLVSINGIGYAIVMEDGKDETKLPIIEERGGLVRPDEIKRQEPEYAPGEVIIKLKEPEASQEALFAQPYSVTKASHEDILSNLKSKYNLKDEKPVFQALHNQLKAKNLSLQQLNAQEEAKSPQQAARRPQDAKQPDLLPIYILKTDQNVLETCARLNEDPEIEYAEPNYIMEVQMVPNDPYYASSGSWGQSYDDLWGLKSDKLNCEAAWDITQGEGVVVAVIDTGVDYNHEDLAENIWINEDEIPNNGIDDDNNGYVDDVRGYDFSDDDPDPADYYGHGTHVAGTIAAAGNNSLGVIGVGPMAKIMPLKFFPNSTTTNAANAIMYAADNGADVLSNSWGARGYSQTLTNAFSYADSLGCVSVAAAGNSNLDVSAFTPANIDEVIAVAASTQNDEKCSFSNFGRLIDVSAPGGGYVNELGSGKRDIYNILSTMPDDSGIATEKPYLKVSDGYWRLAGTSMACPHAAGVVALIRSLYPDDPPSAIRGRLMAGADNIDGLNPGFEYLLGMGRVNAYNSATVMPRPVFKIVAIGKDNIYPGNNGSVTCYVKNYWEDALGVVATLSTDHPLVIIHNSDVNLGDILEGEIKSNVDDPFIISVDQSIPLGETINFSLALTTAGGYAETSSFNITITFFVDVGIQTNLPLHNDMLLYSAVMRDYNNDGYTDVCYMAYPGIGSMGLYRNSQDGSFINSTDEAGIYFGTLSYTSLFLDIDNDGNQDLFIGCNDGNKLFLSNGDGTFADITEASNVINTPSSFAAVSLDYNNDGFLDIFGGRQPLFLLRNNGDNTFTDVIQETGLPATEAGFSIGQLVALDYDNDNYQDLMITSYSSRPESIKLYRNNGDGTFTDATQNAGIDTSRGGAGAVAAGDYDNDGYIDIFLTNFYDRYALPNGNALYRNNCNGTFSDVTEEAGNPGLGTGGDWWGTDFFDYDNDGDLDLYITNPGSYEITTNTLYRNNGDGTFTYITDMAFPQEVSPAWAPACMGDYDNDGDLDIYAPSGIGGGAFLKNMIGTLSNNWIKIKLEGEISNRDAYGAKVYVKTGSHTQLREVHTSSVESQPIHFGLGTATLLDEIEVYWPSGIIQRLHNLAANQLITIAEDLVVPYFDPTPQDQETDTGVELSFSVNGVDPLGGSIVYWMTFYDVAFDIDGDNDVDAGDLTVILDALFTQAGDPGYIPEADLNSNGYINHFDLALFTGGRTTYPEGISFNENTGEFNWTPDSTQSGTYDVTFSVLNDTPPFRYSSKDVTITIYELPRPSNLIATALPSREISLTWQDNSSNEERFIIERSLNGRTFSYRDEVTENIESYIDTGLERETEYHYRVFASNEAGPSAYSNIASAIIPDNAPVLGYIGRKIAFEGYLLEFTISATDPDDDPLTFPTPEDLPEGATFADNTDNTATFSWVPPPIERTTNYYVTFTVTDGTLSDSERVNIVVLDVPQEGGMKTLRPIRNSSTKSMPIKAAEPFTQKNSPNKVITPAQSPSSSVDIKMRPPFSFSNIAFSSTSYIPYIERVESSEDTSGKYLVIEGKNFAKKKDLKVYFNDGGEDIEAEVISRKDGHIKCEIPSGLPAGEYDITVVTDSGRSKGKDFKIPAE